ncbi:MAG TPA: putative DNA modification/repair radical SAM protein [Rectinemataceae bacterium]
MDIGDKIGVLADAAKYDASCSTSGSGRKNQGRGLGNCSVGGICHAWSADGRCVALLKVLLSNACSYDCAYCVNRRSNDLRRAGFEPEELVRLIVDFYRRNYIEGAFLSSGVIGSPDATMERLIWVAKTLRQREKFHGYIHLKIIPGASDTLVLEAATWADRVSVNIELPSAGSLERVAPDKKPMAILGPMRTIARASGFLDSPMRVPPGVEGRAADGSFDLGPGAKALIELRRREPRPQERSTSPLNGAGQARPSVYEARKSRKRDPESGMIPAGQTTQMVVGASPESDAVILGLAESLYLAYDVRRVYYSAFVPTGSDPRLPVVDKPPLAREHRLYQADWLFRFYGFKASEILDGSNPFLEPDLDPKSAWALRHLQFFPVELMVADYPTLLRVPGIGPKSASRIIQARRKGGLRTMSLSRLGVVMRRAKWFLCLGGRLLSAGDPDSSPPTEKRIGAASLERPEFLRDALRDPRFREPLPAQAELPWGCA